MEPLEVDNHPSPSSHEFTSAIVVDHDPDLETWPSRRPDQQQQQHNHDMLPRVHRPSSTEPSRLVLQSIFLLLGVGLLVPWNAFISAKEYYTARFCPADTSSRSSSPSSSLESTFALVYNLASVVSMGLILLIQWLRDQCNWTPTTTEEPVDDNTDTMTTQPAQASSTDEQEQMTVPLSTSSTEHVQHSSLEHQNSNRNTSTGRSSTMWSSQEQHSSGWMVLFPLTMYGTVFIGQAVLVVIRHVPALPFWTLASLALCGACIATASAGIVASAGLLDPTVAMSPYLAGQSVGGVAVSMANFMAAWWEDPQTFWQAHCVHAQHDHSWPRDLAEENQVASNQSECTPYQKIDWAVFTYFSLGAVVLALCLVGYWYIDRILHGRGRHYTYESVGDSPRAIIHHEHPPLHLHGIHVDDSPRVGLELYHARLQHNAEETASVEEVLHHSMHNPVEALHSQSSGDPLLENRKTNHHGSAISPPAAALGSDDPSNETAAVWKHVRGDATCIFFTFLVTLALFPAWTSELASIRQCRTRFRLSNDLYVPFGFVVFNVGDLTGRILSSRIQIQRMHRLSNQLVLASLLRFLFFPLLFYCYSASSVRRNRFHIPSDLYSFTIQFLFAMTNGLLVNTAFLHAPTQLPSTTMDMQERMSEILTFAVAFGLLSGSMLSYPISKLS